jgi:hypothetical protein
VKERGRGLVTADEPTVVAKPSFDAIVVEDGESDGRLATPASTNQSNRRERFRESDSLLDQLVASKEDPRWWG